MGSDIINSQNMRNPMEKVMPFLQIRDLVSLGLTCREQRERVHDYWLKFIKVFKSPPITPEGVTTREQRIIYQVVVNGVPNLSLESSEFCSRKVSDCHRRLFRPKNESPCNPAICGPGELYSLYQEKYDQNLLIFANVIAEQLSRPVFNSPWEARVWLNDPNNQAQLQGIETLSLSMKGLEILPAEIGQLAALKRLTASYNQLTSLPPEISQLAALKMLDVEWNQLTSLPPEIGQLAALKRLDVHYNQLTSLPPEISQLAALKRLNASCNKLTSLPVEIRRLAALEELDVHGNRLTSLPPGLEGREGLRIER